jgi:DNA-binding transcriptional LysR family regulator
MMIRMLGRLFEIIERTVDEIDRLMREQRQSQHHPAARLRTDYAFSQFWLIPRMHAFRLRHPQTDIQIIATQRFEAGAMEEGDIAVAFGPRTNSARTRDCSCRNPSCRSRRQPISIGIQAAYPPRG